MMRRRQGSCQPPLVAREGASCSCRPDYTKLQEGGGENEQTATQSQPSPTPIPPTLFGWRSRAFNDQVYAIFLEHAPVPSSAMPASWISRAGVKALNWLVSAAQPKPVFSHVELMCFPGKLGTSEQHQLVHFSTYMGQHADWQRSGPFYLDDSTRTWRALPLYDRVGFESEVRSSCNRIRGAQYSIARYPLAWPPFGWMRRFVSRGATAPGQCADVTARVLHLAHVDPTMVPEPSVNYGPSRLYIAFAKYLIRTSAPSDALVYESDSSTESLNELGELGVQGLLDRRRFDMEETRGFALLHAADRDLENITHDDAEAEIARLSDATLVALHGPDQMRSVQSERRLAKALFRWAHELARRYNTTVQSDDACDVPRL